MTPYCPYCDQIASHLIEKYCSQCGKMVPHILMAKNNRSKDGLRSLCKTHWAAYMKTRYVADKPAWAKRMARYKKTHRTELTKKEKMRRRGLVADPILGPDIRKHAAQKAAAWRAANPDKAHASVNTYCATNKDKINKRRRERYSEDPTKPLANNKKRKARIRGATQNDLTAAQWQAIKEHYGYRCVYCSRKMKRLTQDHITPVSQGGPHTVQNVVPACVACNAKKRTGPPPKPIQPLLFV